MLVSIGALMFFDPAAALAAMIGGAEDAVLLSINLVALYGIWLGLFEVLEQTGVSAWLAKALTPLIRWLFKGESTDAERFIAMNISANLLGLGNAATPMGIGAIGAMKPHSDPSKASINMIMLIVISATSLQIFPSTVIGLRASAGSADPAAFLPACIAATITSTIVGVFLVKLAALLIKRLPKKTALAAQCA